jgi:hypothetical protein
MIPRLTLCRRRDLIRHPAVTKRVIPDDIFMTPARPKVVSLDRRNLAERF